MKIVMTTVNLAILACAGALLVAVALPASPSPPSEPAGRPVVRESQKPLAEEVAALQQVVASQQATIAELQKALKRVQSDLAAIKRGRTPAVAVAVKKTNISGNPIFGDADAPVTIVEFSDFECPYCASFHKGTFHQVKKDYIDTGKVRFVYRDLPLTSIHQRAYSSALAAECANEQGQFWGYHDLLLSGQNDLSDESYMKWAQQLNLDVKRFTGCMDANKYKSEIDKDIADAMKAGINGTPGFIVGHTRADGLLEGPFIGGAQPYANFQAVIEGLLNSPPGVAPRKPIVFP